MHGFDFQLPALTGLVPINGLVVPAAPSAAAVAIPPDVSSGLSLFLKLKNPAQMPALLADLEAAQAKTNLALKELHYVHFARFLPSPDFTTLWVITEFDGDFAAYILDFAIAIGDVFTTILMYIDGAPRLPVKDYPADFLRFVTAHNIAVGVYSAYPDKTVLEILGPLTDLPSAVSHPPVQAVDPTDVQGNILKGYASSHGHHFAIAFDDSALGKSFVGGLVDGTGALQVTTAVDWGKAKPKFMLNIGFTASGLLQLGIGSAIVDLFPASFRDGPAEPKRADANGDIGASAPATWDHGNPTERTDAVLSIFAFAAADLATAVAAAQARFSTCRVRIVSEMEVSSLPANKLHFGYSEGFSEPQVAQTGVTLPAPRPDMQPQAPVGDFLLGAGYSNTYGGNSLGDLPSDLCSNATFSVIRVISQDVQVFEAALAAAASRHGMTREFVAARLMGRTFEGAPLSLPSGGAGDNEFDFAPTTEFPGVFDDGDGLRCPVGAHLRRMNPRGARVAGRAHSRRLIRRGMPYGPLFDPAHPDARPRGLFGVFICADIERQFEFIVQQWANRGLAARGLRGTRDPIIGNHATGGGQFIIRTRDARDPIVLDLPPLTSTRGSFYLFVPGIAGLKTIAAATP